MHRGASFPSNVPCAAEDQVNGVGFQLRVPVPRAEGVVQTPAGPFPPQSHAPAKRHVSLASHFTEELPQSCVSLTVRPLRQKNRAIFSRRHMATTWVTSRRDKGAPCTPNTPLQTYVRPRLRCLRRWKMQKQRWRRHRCGVVSVYLISRLHGRFRCRGKHLRQTKTSALTENGMHPRGSNPTNNRGDRVRPKQRFGHGGRCCPDSHVQPIVRKLLHAWTGARLAQTEVQDGIHRSPRSIRWAVR